MVVLFLFRITVKAQVIEYSGCSQSERKCHPYSYDSPIHDETEKIVQLSFHDYQPINEINQKELIKKHLNYLGLEEKETKEHQGSYEVVLKDGEKVDFTFEKGMYYFNTSVVIDATEPQAIRRK